MWVKKKKDPDYVGPLDSTTCQLWDSKSVVEPLGATVLSPAK